MVRRARAQFELVDALPHDAPALAAIFNEGVEDRVATFQSTPSAVAEFAARIAGDGPLVVARAGERALGWSGVVPYSARDYYAAVGEYQVYVARAARGRGVGRSLLEALVERCERSGYLKLVGKLFADNAASVALAHSCGFRDVGVHQRHGRLDGRWRDVLVVERLLGETASGR